MGKKSSSSAPPVDPRMGQAMLKQAQLAEQQQAWYENEMYPWLQSQTQKQNEYAEADRAFAQKNAQWWQDRAQQQLDTQNSRADEYYNRWKDKYLPIENSLIADASKYNTSAEAERQAQAAIGDYATQFANQRQAQNMQMQAYGLNPTAGAYVAQNKALGLNEAALKAAAANQARQAAESLGWQKKTQLAALGQQYIGNSMQQQQINQAGAQGMGSLANQSLGQASQFGQLGTQNITNLANVGLQSYGSLQNAWGQYGNMAMDVSRYNQSSWDMQQQQKGAQQAGAGAMIGTVATAAATAF